MRALIKRLALASTLAAIGLAAAGTASARDVRCDSSRNSYNYCSVDTRGGVRLVDQESRARCDYRDTWGYDAKGIWVSNGCRAVFRVGAESSRGNNDKAAGIALGILALGIIAGMAEDDRRPSQPHHPDYVAPRTIRCESGDKRYTYCRVRVPSYAELVRQRSSAACSYGRTWGYDSRGVWVDKGCRGDFAVR